MLLFLSRFKIPRILYEVKRPNYRLHAGMQIRSVTPIRWPVSPVRWRRRGSAGRSGRRLWCVVPAWRWSSCPGRSTSRPRASTSAELDRDGIRLLISSVVRFHRPDLRICGVGHVFQVTCQEPAGSRCCPSICCSRARTAVTLMSPPVRTTLSRASWMRCWTSRLRRVAASDHDGLELH
jgi:hypothetical protein